MRSKLLYLMIVFFVFAGCKENVDPDICSDIHFGHDTYRVGLGEDYTCEAVIEPESCVDNYVINFSVVNESVVKINYSEKNMTNVTGIKKGATILKCELAETEFIAKSIINVYQKEAVDESRSIGKIEEDGWYLYTVSYLQDGYDCVTECFYKTKPYDYCVEDGIFKIELENGRIITVPMNDLLDLGFEEVK